MNLYFPYRLAQILSRNLPRPFAYWLGMRLADCFFAFDRKGRRAVIANLRQIFRHQGQFPDQHALNVMARRNFEHFGKYLADFFRFARIHPDAVHELVKMEHFEYLNQAQSYDKGVIIVTAHFGNWELGGTVMTALGYKLSAVFQPETTRGVNRIFQQHRTGRGIHGIALGQAARSVIKVLKNKGLAAMLADRDFSHHTQTIDFFGAPARLPNGPARMAFKTGAPVLPIFISRKDDDSFLMRLYPPIVPDEFSSATEIHLRIRDVLEKEITLNPLQWYIFEEFWRKE